jgi:hypothetical protein
VNRKIILPLLALLLAVMACQTQSAPPSPVISIVTPSTITPMPPVPTNTSSAPAASGLTLDMLKNGTYHAPVYDRNITLVNGTYTNGSSTDPYSVRMLDLVAFGDLNGDGISDAAIILVENGGGSGEFETVVALLDAGGAVSQAGQAQLGDRVQVKSMTISSGTLALDMLVQGPKDPMCCPSQPETQSYRMTDNAFWMTRLGSTTPDNHERSITVSSPADGAEVTNPFTVNGSVTIAPFENTLAYRIFLPDGTKVNEAPLMVDSGGIAGGPGTFSQVFNLSNAGITGPVLIQFLDLSAADGSTLAMGSLALIVH